MDVPWRDMAGMRHRLIHGYAEVRIDLVWQVASERLRPLIGVLQAIVSIDADDGTKE
jgi:uncharacterized protein with HEPN domain